MSGPVLLTAATREGQPWKNGGGRTSEVVAYPVGSGMDDFGWRISIADVDEDGPFSIFPLVKRHIVVLAGTLRLRFEEFDRVISAGDRPFSFSGDEPVMGHLVNGPVRDLNLMVRTDRYAGSLRVSGPGHLRVASPTSVLVALQYTTIIVDDVTFELHPEDALLLSGPADVEGSSALIVAQVLPLISDAGNGR